MKGICQICKIMPADETHHIKWVTDGGTSDNDNLIDVCHECHRYAPNDPSLLAAYKEQGGVYGEIIRYAIIQGYLAARDGCEEDKLLEKINNDLSSKIFRDGHLKNIEFYFQKDRSRTVKRKMREKAITGTSQLGGGHPYGYNVRDGKFIIDVKEAPIVKEIFVKYLSGKSTTRIAHMLKTRLVPTKRGGDWDAPTVAYILKNALYAGYVEWEDTLRKGSHTAIIDSQTFNQAQERLVHMVRRPEQKYKTRLLPIENNDSASETRKGGQKRLY